MNRAQARKEHVAPLCVSPKTFAKLIDSSERTVTKLITESRIESFKIGKSRRIPVSEAARLIREGIDRNQQEGVTS